MPSEFAEEQPKLVEESYPTDPEYLKTVALRSKFQELKKLIPKLCIPLEATMRAKMTVKEDEKS